MLQMGEGSFIPLECSSGCESGWTMYLEHSLEKITSLSTEETSSMLKDGGFVVKKEHGFDEMEAGEDLSMLSDASSPPLHFNEDEEYLCDKNGCFCSSSSATLPKKNEKKRRAEIETVEEDTASSHVFTFSKKCFSLNNKLVPVENALDVSIGFSATRLLAKSAFEEAYGLSYTSQPLGPSSARTGCRKANRGKLW